MKEIVSYFTALLVLMLFYSFAMTGYVYALPEDTIVYVDAFRDIGTDLDLDSLTGDVEESFSRQTNIPVIDVGSLVFYSGNFLIDMMVNFIYAIPEMIGLLLNGIMLLVGVDSYMFALVEVFVAAVMTVLYILGMVRLLLGVRSGRVIA